MCPVAQESNSCCFGVKTREREGGNCDHKRTRMRAAVKASERRGGGADKANCERWMGAGTGAGAGVDGDDCGKRW